MLKEPTNTKEEIIYFLKFNGLTDPDQIAKKLEKTGMCIRQHLYELKDEGFIDFSEEKSSGKGRPKKLWFLTSEANQFFPDKNKELLMDLIDEIKDQQGNEQLQHLLKSLFNRKKEKYTKLFQGCSNLEDKLNLFVKERQGEGFMSKIEKASSDKYTYCESHCSICVTATENKVICDVELDFFRELFSDDFTIERHEYIADGAVKCTYEFQRKGPV